MSAKCLCLCSAHFVGGFCKPLGVFIPIKKIHSNSKYWVNKPAQHQKQEMTAAIPSWVPINWSALQMKRVALSHRRAMWGSDNPDGPLELVAWSFLMFACRRIDFYTRTYEGKKKLNAAAQRLATWREHEPGASILPLLRPLRCHMCVVSCVCACVLYKDTYGGSTSHGRQPVIRLSLCHPSTDSCSVSPSHPPELMLRRPPRRRRCVDERLRSFPFFPPLSAK